MKILFVGDIVGRPGRDAALAIIPGLRVEHDVDLVVANAENVAGGWGITPDIARLLLSVGEVDVLTMGNHTWAKEDSKPYFDSEPRLLRPANYPKGTPGRGFGIFKTQSGAKIAIANLNGRALMEPLECPFRCADEIIACVQQYTPNLLIDFHAETTSEKAAFGWHCDGRVSAVVGTHTHVQTADERILPGGTAFITDVGMCGPMDSVIGMEISVVLEKYRTQMPHRFRVADNCANLCGVVVDLDETTGRARSILRVSRMGIP